MSLSDNLIAHYKMNDNAATTVVLNAVAAPHGSSNQNTDQLAVAGKVNGALQFNGTSDFVDTGQTFQATFRDSFTVCLWLNLQDGQIPFLSGSVVFGVDELLGGQPEDCWFMLLHETPGNLLAWYGAGDGSSDLSSGLTELLPDGETGWFFITIVIEKLSPTQCKMSLYKDSILQSNPLDTGIANISMGNHTPSYSLVVGGFNRGGNVLWTTTPKTIDNFMIFNKALTTDEISYLYNGADGTEDVSGYIAPSGGMSGAEYLSIIDDER